MNLKFKIVKIALPDRGIYIYRTDSDMEAKNLEYSTKNIPLSNQDVDPKK